MPSEYRVRVPDRSQMVMTMGCPDDLITADHPARLIWNVCGRLDLSKFYQTINAVEGSAGRNANDPRLMVAVWLYAVTRGVGSARELDRLCKESKPFQWLCGGVSMNYHTLSDFRVRHGEALDKLFTQVIASLTEKKLVKVWRISQDGTRVRACAGTSSFRRKRRLEQLLEQAKAHVEELKAQLDDPAAGAGLSAKRKAAKRRAAQDRLTRIDAAMKRVEQLAEERVAAAKKNRRKKPREGEVRASTTDAEARVMKMANGGYSPAVNIQLATDTKSRAIVGVDVCSATNDASLAEPMRRQVEGRSGEKVQEHLVDGGYLNLEEVQRAEESGVQMYVPPKAPRDPQKRGNEFEPRESDSPELRQWRARMGSEEGKMAYKQRAATSETVNADLKAFRGLGQLTVRGLAKAKCVALWSALAYNLMHFGRALLV